MWFPIAGRIVGVLELDSNSVLNVGIHNLVNWSCKSTKMSLAFSLCKLLRSSLSLSRLENRKYREEWKKTEKQSPESFFCPASHKILMLRVPDQPRDLVSLCIVRRLLSPAQHPAGILGNRLTYINLL